MTFDIFSAYEKGDSGGPLTCETENGPMQVGLTAWRLSNNTQLVTVYTDIGIHAEWIEDVLEEINRPLASSKGNHLLCRSLQYSVFVLSILTFLKVLQ